MSVPKSSPEWQEMLLLRADEMMMPAFGDVVNEARTLSRKLAGLELCMRLQGHFLW